MNWKPAMKYETVDFGEPVGSLSGCTQNTSVLMPVSGSKARILLNNTMNPEVMKIESIILKTDREEVPVTVNSLYTAELQPDEQIYTDPAAIRIQAGDILRVEIRFAKADNIRAMCQTWAARSWHSDYLNVDGTEADCTKIFEWLANDVHHPSVIIGFSQIDIECDEKIKVLTMFGDSITHLSHYSDALLERVMEEYRGCAVIANAGLGGNRLCYDASVSPNLGIHSSVFGKAGYKRFEEEVFGTCDTDCVLMLEGVNDITHCYQYRQSDQIPTAESFIRHYQEVIACAHQHHAEIWIGTILPENVFENEEWFNLSESLRIQINTWIRNSSEADGVIDFEAIGKDENGRLKSGFHLDGLHPNTEGGKEMAAAVPLEKILNPD